MNGAADRLQRMREQSEQVARELEQAALDLAFVQRGIDQVTVARNQVVLLIQDLRNAQTLAGPQNWRLLAGYDETFTYEFLRNVDDNILRVALRALPPEVRQRLREDLEEAGRE